MTAIKPNGDGWKVETEATATLWQRRPNKRTFTADNLVVAAGTWGTQNLLHRMKDNGNLPKLPPSLGKLTRTNSEACLVPIPAGTIQTLITPKV